jgi:hypothetical protein
MAPRLSSILDPTNVFTGEKGRGVLTHLTAGVVTNGLYAFTVGHLGILSVEAGIILISTLFGNTLAYSMDILFAKRDFKLPGTSVVKPVAYADVARRARYLLRSYVRKQFMRYAVTAIIDAMFTIAVVRATIAYLDSRRILTEYKYRDTLVAIGVAAVNFFLFVNILRFDWAYKDTDEPMFNIVVLMWMALSIMAYALFKASELQAQNNNQPGPQQAPPLLGDATPPYP